MKTYLFAILIFLSTNTQAQIFFSIDGTTKVGPGLSVGYLSKPNIEIKLGCAVPMRKANVSSIFYLSAGHKINITNNDEDNYTLTNSIGVGHYRIDNFDDWYREYGSVKTITKILPFFGMELGKDKNHGRYYISVNYCGDIYASAGMRVFIN